ncbi:MAG TPA: hypothetical protein PLU97_00140 [Candidatus Cryptobacteroides sp.]|jgi:uncharacterized CHY-type Zn-finger protein|nr:hypothetical protein [Rikenellaceae bacterium]HOE93791.1 hypothetical protein [Candidatus Cryptobacteroides sp.]
MAQIYLIRCPECNKKYECIKGILVSECNLDPIPEERLEESPAICPHCGHKLSLQDEGSEQYIEMFFLAD